MKYLLLLPFLVSCAHSDFYHDGRKVASLQANFSSLEIDDGTFHLRATGINHSTPTRAGGSVLGTGLAGAVPIVTSIATGL